MCGVSRVCTGRCTVTHIIVDCGNFKSVFYSMCFRWSPVEHSRTMDYGVTQVTSVVMTVSQSVRRVRLSSPFTPAVLPVASQPASPTPLPSLVSISDLWCNTALDDTNILHHPMWWLVYRGGTTHNSRSAPPPGIQEFRTLQYISSHHHSTRFIVHHYKSKVEGEAIWCLILLILI